MHHLEPSSCRSRANKQLGWRAEQCCMLYCSDLSHPALCLSSLAQHLGISPPNTTLCQDPHGWQSWHNAGIFCTSPTDHFSTQSTQAGLFLKTEVSFQRPSSSDLFWPKVVLAICRISVLLSNFLATSSKTAVGHPLRTGGCLT